MENRDYDGVVIGVVINGECIEEGIIDRDRGVILVSSKRHATEVSGEFDSCGCPRAGAYRQWDREGLGRGGGGDPWRRWEGCTRRRPWE